MKKLTILFLKGIITVISGCAKNMASTNSAFDSNNIIIKLINRQNLPEGLSFAFSFKNKNSSTIIQNNVFVSFPIKVQKGTTNNPMKAMAEGNKLNIKKDEEVQLHVFIPKEVIEDNKYLDIEHPQIDITGYHDEVKDENHFGITSPLE